MVASAEFPAFAGPVAEGAMDEERRSSEREPIKVVDRRKFTVDGDLRPDAHDSARDSEIEEDRRPTDKAGGAGARPPEEPAGFEHRPLEEPKGVEFTMLINAMTHPALVFLGEIPHPDGNAVVEPEQARIQIDLLELLRVKCRGNLTPEEDRLLDQVLYQLRMLYVQKTGGGSTGSPETR